jgi:serine/threonine-protein kinase RsbW
MQQTDEVLHLPDAHQHDAIRLVLPPDTGLVRIARLVASGVAATAGFDVQEVEDLRIAVDEACSSIIEMSSGEPIELRFVLDGTQVTIDISGNVVPGQGDEEANRFSQLVLAAVVDACHRDRVGGALSFRLVKSSYASRGSDG